MKFVSISSLQRTTKPMTENEVTCVLKNNEPLFYTVSAEKMQEFNAAMEIASEPLIHGLDLFKMISGEMTGYELAELHVDGVLNKDAFKRIVMAIAVNYAGLKNHQDIIDVLNIGLIR